MKEYTLVTTAQITQIVKCEAEADPIRIAARELAQHTASVFDDVQILGVQMFEMDKDALKVQLDMGAYMPERAHATDAGLDLKTPESFVIPAGGSISIDTGVHIAIPRGHVGLLTSKSGLMRKGITSRGTIDSGYTGSITAVLFNHGQSDIVFQEGQKITQLVIVPIITPELNIVTALEETERGAGGFGSSGL